MENKYRMRKEEERKGRINDDPMFWDWVKRLMMELLSEIQNNKEGD
jgi:hypothetical protein